MPTFQVKDYMNKQVVSFSANTPIAVAVERLIKSSQIGAPIVDDNKQVIGWVSEQDCLDKMLKSSYHCDGSALLEDIIKPQVLSASPQDNVLDLASQMLGQKPKSYPVVEAGKLVGIITRRDVLKAVNQHLNSCYTRQPA